MKAIRAIFIFDAGTVQWDRAEGGWSVTIMLASGEQRKFGVRKGNCWPCETHSWALIKPQSVSEPRRRQFVNPQPLKIAAPD